MGSVKEVSGNLMPGPDREPPQPKSVQTTVYVYETTNLSQVKGDGTLFTSIQTKLVDSIVTDEKGLFGIALKPGSYSLFARVDGKYFANNFDTKNNIQLVTVEEGKVTEVSILINDKATY